MKHGKILIVAGMIAAVILGHSFAALASEPPRPGTNPYLPEYWAVVFVDCNGDSAATPPIKVLTSVRAKKVDDCDVETKAVRFPLFLGECPAGGLTEADVKNQVFRDYVLFDGVGDPGIYKVRNFKEVENPDGSATGIYSFDAMIRYWRAAP